MGVQLQMDSLREALTGSKPQHTLRRALDIFADQMALACSFSAEDTALVDMLCQLTPNPRVFALDTGRLHEATYEVMERVRERYGITIEVYFPETSEVERLEREQGFYSFRTSLEARHACCQVRKVEPLGRALAGLQAWITGLRREQSVTRAGLEVVERDDAHGGIVKLNPLADWSSEQVWEYIRRRGVPYNRLHDEGYPSIGCEPCTRAVGPGEHPRAGRWWWELPEHKECGLHVAGAAVRASDGDQTAGGRHGRPADGGDRGRLGGTGA